LAYQDVKQRIRRNMERWNPEPNIRAHIGVFDTFEEAHAARAEKIRGLK
jgi:hypothetical protein